MSADGCRSEITINIGGMSQTASFIIRLYFAVIAAATLFMMIYASVDLLSIGLKTYVFPAADAPAWLEECSSNVYTEYPRVDESIVTVEEQVAQCEERNVKTLERYQTDKAQSAVQDLAMLIVTIPLFIWHFRFVYRDWTRSQGTKPKSKK